MLEKVMSVSGERWGRRGAEGRRDGGPLGRVFIRALEKGAAGGKFVHHIEGKPGGGGANERRKCLPPAIPKLDEGPHSFITV